MGNQQRRIGDRLNWLGGIIDGDGMVTITKKHQTKRDKVNNWNSNSWSPRISVVNTNMVMINEVIDIQIGRAHV